MKPRFPKISIGLRTIKTALAVILALMVTESFGTTDSKLIFAMLGAMSAVQPTYKESLEACLSQIIGVVFGAICSIFLCALPLPPLVAIGTGIVLVITLYNILQIRYSPSLPCFILVLSCTTANVQPFTYATGRIWDTTIGLAIGMLVNMLIFPYDTSRQIRTTAHGLNEELLLFLQDYFDGDDILPELKGMRKQIMTLEKQFKLFSNQKLLLHLRRQSEEIITFRACEDKAKALITHLEVLSSLEKPGRLNPENLQRLADCGAVIRDLRPQEAQTEEDIVTNYHVSQILNLRTELLIALEV